MVRTGIWSGRIRPCDCQGKGSEYHRGRQGSDREETKPIETRFSELKKLASERSEKVFEIYPHGTSNIAKQLSSTYLIDFISIYLAILYEIDPSITPSIDNLKITLKKELNSQEDLKKKVLS